MIIRKSVRPVQLVAIIYLLLGIGTLAFDAHWLHLLWGTTTYFLLPGLFLAALLGLVETNPVLMTAFGLILSPALAIGMLYASIQLGGLGLAGGETAVSLLSATLALATLLFPRQAAHTFDKKMPPVDRWFYMWLAFLLLLAAPLLHTRVQVSFHGLFHTSIVHDILNGNIPPQNPGFYGRPVNTYWHFHLFLAAVAEQSHISALIASTILRVSGLISSYLLAGLLVRCITPKFNPWPVALFALLCINLAGSILVIADIPGSSRWQDVLTGNMKHPASAVRAVWFDETRTASSIAKFLNFNAFCYSLALWTGALVFTMNKQLSPIIRSLLFFLISAGAISFHVPSSPAFLFLLPAVMALDILIYHRQSLGQSAKQIAVVALPFAAALLLWLPYWRPVLASHDVQSVNQGLGSLFTNSAEEVWANLKLITGAFWPLLPLLIAAPFVWKRPSRSLTSLFAVAVGCLLFAFSLQVLDGNQYKFVLLGALPVGVTAVISFDLLFPAPGKLKQGAMLLGLLLAMLTNSFISIGYLRSAWWNDTTLTNSGTHIDYAKTGAYAFVRTESEKTAVILEPPIDVDKSYVGAAAGRAGYFRKSAFGYYDTLPDYAERKNLIKNLFTPGTEKTERLHQLAQTIPADIYMLLDRDLFKGDYEGLVMELTAVPNLQLVFSDEGGAVFKLITN